MPSAHVFQSLRSRLTGAQAVETFTGGAAGCAIGLFRGDRLRSIAPVYVPYHLFRVEISEKLRTRNIPAREIKRPAIFNSRAEQVT